jgi:hypothetical protein
MPILAGIKTWPRAIFQITGNPGVLLIAPLPPLVLLLVLVLVRALALALLLSLTILSVGLMPLRMRCTKIALLLVGAPVLIPPP